MAEIKGVLLNGWMAFLNDRYGAETVSGAVKRLAPEDQRLLASRFLDSSWYKYDTLHALRRLTRPLVGASGQNLSIEIGRFMAEYVFTGVYRSFLVRDPVEQVKKFSWIGEFFFREARKLETEVKSDSHCLVRYRYEAGAAPTRAICESLVGFWSRTIEMSGAPRVKANHVTCVARGAPCCEFVFEWDPDARST